MVVGEVGGGLGGGGLGGGGSPGLGDVVFFLDVVVVVVGAVELLAGPDVGATDVLVGSEENVSGVVSSNELFRFSGDGVASSRAPVSDATVANTVETTTSATPSAM